VSAPPAGLTLPFVSEADPDTQQEGSLDPLGLAALADRLADEIAPEVTARMGRVRFATAIAVCSCVLEEPLELTAADGTPSYLAFEWLVVEAMVRRPPGSGTEAVPGIQKARRRLRGAGAHLGASSYLLVPKVFGFHGIYKRLARDLGLVDDALALLPRGEALVSTWEAEQGLPGFVRGTAGSVGGLFARKLRDEARRALDDGVVRLPVSSRYWSTIAAAFAPSDAGARERRQLWGWLTDDSRPLRRELLRLLAHDPDPARSERTTLERLRAEPLSADLRLRLKAIDHFEALVRCLDDVFQLIRVQTTQAGTTRIHEASLGNEPVVREAAERLPSRFAATAAALEPLDRSGELEGLLGVFAEPADASELVRRMLDRHDAVQRAKDKRSWFERDERDVAIRPIAQRHEAFAPRSEYLHPYRFRALSTFARDLRPPAA